jgi:acyl-CoA thioester hydrolase
MEESFKFHIEQQVAWGEMDAMQHLNNVHYLRYMENARIAYMQAVNMLEFSNQGEVLLGPILASAELQYLRPVVYPDTLQVGIRVIRIGETSIQMEYLMTNQAGDAVLKGSTRVVMFDYKTGRKAAVPQALTKRIEDLEGVSLTA